MIWCLVLVLVGVHDSLVVTFLVCDLVCALHVPHHGGVSILFRGSENNATFEMATHCRAEWGMETWLVVCF